MRVNHNKRSFHLFFFAVVSDLCKDTKMRVNHNNRSKSLQRGIVVSDLCKDTKMRVNHNFALKRIAEFSLFLIYAKILK